MANTSNATKRERKRLKAEQLRAAQRRRERRRTIGYTLGAIAVLGVAVAIIASASGGSGGEGGEIVPSASGRISVSGAPRSEMLAVGDAIPAFSGPGFRMRSSGDGGYTISREPVDWSEYDGAPTVLSIWAPWCPHCQVELPILSEAVARHPSVKLVTVVTSIGAHPGPSPNGYLADNGLTFPAAIDDARGTLARALGVQAFPTLYFVGSDGTVAYAQDGEVPAEVLDEELSKLG
jgi:thiol-disulfide isomerase/thioredoxin